MIKPTIKAIKTATEIITVKRIFRSVLFLGSNLGSLSLLCSSFTSLYSIAKKYNVSISSIQKENNIENGIIYPNQVLKIPASVKIKNVKTIEDVSNVTGLSVDYLKELENIENPNDIRTIFLDKNNNKTIGVGHKLSADEINTQQNKFNDSLWRTSLQ